LAAQRAVLVQGPGRRGALELAESLLAVLDEDVAHRLARGRADIGVGVAELHPEPAGAQRADRRLARAGRADQHDERAPLGHATTRALR
jgi:hypothetical protein